MRKKLLSVFIVILLLNILGCGTKNESNNLNGKIELKYEFLNDNYTKVKIYWNSIIDVEGYKIYKNGNYYKSINSVEIEEKIKLGESVNYSVMAYKGNKTTDMSNTITVKSKDYNLEKTLNDIVGDIKFIEFGKLINFLAYITEYSNWGKLNCSDDDSNNWNLVSDNKNNIKNITAFSVNDNGTKIIGGYTNGELKLFGSESLIENMSSTIQSISFKENNKCLVVTENNIKEIDLVTQGSIEIKNINEIKKDGELIFGDILQDGSSRTIVAYKNGIINIFYADNIYKKEILKTNNEFDKIKLSKDKNILAISYKNKNKIEFREINGNEPDKWGTIKREITLTENIKYFDMSLNADKILISDLKNKVYLYDEENKLIKEFDFSNEEYSITGLAISKDGEIIAIGIKDKIKVFKLKENK